MPHAAGDAARFHYKAIRPLLSDAHGECPRFVLGNEGKRTPRREAVERFANLVGAFPRRESSEINFRRLCHARHVLAGISALLPETVNREESEWYGLWDGW
jgi:hypothetical protein